MYKVYFEDTFFEGLNYFISSMKKYYYNLYSNTGLYDEEKIVKTYFEIYEKMKTDVLNEINIICENGIIGRKVNYTFENIENCSFIFKHGNYLVTFTANKYNTDKKVIINSLKIEI